MFNWLKEKLMKWLCIGKIVEFIEIQQNINVLQAESDNIRDEQIKTLQQDVKRLEWLCGVPPKNSKK